MSSQPAGPRLGAKSRLTRCLIVLAFALLGVSSLYGDIVEVTQDHWDESRNSDGEGITATGDWDNGGFELSWKITDEGDGTFEYEYQITSPDGDGLVEVLNYLILQLTPLDADWTGIFDESAEVGDWVTPEGALFGVKFEEGTLEVAFVSQYAPTWGSFYATDGEGLVAYNNDFGGMPSFGDTDFTNWIAIDGVAVPEPSTLVLLLSSIGLVAGAAGFRKMI